MSKDYIYRRCIDVMTLVVDGNVTTPDYELLQEICGESTEEVIDELHQKRFLFRNSNGDPWSISNASARKAIKYYNSLI